MAPLVKCGESLGVRMVITARLVEAAGEEPACVVGIFIPHFLARVPPGGASRCIKKPRYS